MHDPAEPLGLAGDDLEELVVPLLVEALRRDPHLGLGVVAAEDLGLLLQEGHEVLRLGVAGVAAGDEDGVDAREPPEDLAPLLEGVLDGLGVGVVLVHGGIPDPDVQAVVVEDLRHPGHHLDLRAGEVGAVRGVVGARGDQLDGVGAEDGEVADVPLPLREVPGVVRVRLRPVAELVPADRHLGRGLDPEPVREEHPPARHPQLAEQPADAEEDASGVVAGDEDHRPFPSRPDPIAFRLPLTAALRERLGKVLREGLEGRRRADGDHGRAVLRPGLVDLPAHLRPRLHLLDQHGHGLALGPGEALRDHDDGLRQVEHPARSGGLGPLRRRGRDDPSEQTDRDPSPDGLISSGRETEHRDSSSGGSGRWNGRGWDSAGC